MTNTITDKIGPFRSELAAKSHRETFMVAQAPHNISLSASICSDARGWYVETLRTPKGD